jgi:hypothetical protein
MDALRILTSTSPSVIEGIGTSRTSMRPGATNCAAGISAIARSPATRERGGPGQ